MHKMVWAAVIAMGVLSSGHGWADDGSKSGDGTSKCDSVVAQSLFGDVYSDPDAWEPLSAGTFFSKGWNKAWVSPPTGRGGAPRQGWLSAYDGVFYRLAVVTGAFADGVAGDSQSFGNLTLYTPFNARFEMQYDVPFVIANSVAPDGLSHSNFGDVTLTPRFLLAESRNTTQSLNFFMRIPSGSEQNGHGITLVQPTYQFWSNPTGRLVVRGGAGIAVPYGTVAVGTRTTGVANLAVGQYLTGHDQAPVGDLVIYLSANASQPLDDKGPRSTAVTLSPGFRTYVGANWYLLGAVDVPVTTARAFDRQFLGALMKVF